MKLRKITALLLSAAMVAGSSFTAFAAAPSAYDGKSYSSLGYTSEDPDGQFNLAVIAKNDVKIVGDAMYIQGSVYSNGDIYVGDGEGNKIDGLFISGTEGSVDVDTANNLSHKCEGYIHVNDNGTRDNITYYSTKPEYEGAVTDEDTSFECVYTPFAVPEIANDLGNVEMNVYASKVWDHWDSEKNESVFADAPNGAKTISEDTHIGNLTMNGTQNNYNNYEAALTIDATNNDVTVVIDNLINFTNPSIKVVGTHKANIYIKNVAYLNNFILNFNTNHYDANWQYDPVISGSTENTYLYLAGNDITLDKNYIAANTVYVNADSLKISGSSEVISDVESGAKKFEITGGATEVTGIVCVPDADSRVVDSGTLYGQLHTDTLTQNGAGRILWKADKGVAAAETTTVEAKVETTTEEVTIPEEETDKPVDPHDNPVDTKCNFAYIFGYEPYIGKSGDVKLYMAGSNNVTREQVCAMVMRIVDQNTGSMGKSYSNVSPAFADYTQWAERGVAFISEKGAFDDVAAGTLHGNWALQRGEVAKIVATGLGLQLQEGKAVEFNDTEGCKYQKYIDIMTSNGFMQGDGNGSFRPYDTMTRGEFCAMFNVVTGREGYSLIDTEGNAVTAETYSFTDADDLNSMWYGTPCLLATSAFTDEGLVDLATRQANIRNTLDKYDSQLQY